MESIFTGKTVEEAIDKGLEELGISREEAEIEVLDEGKKGRIRSHPAQVKIGKKIVKTDGERAVEFLEGLFPLLGAEATPVLTEEGERIAIQITAAEGNKGVIGRRGEIIDAVQTLAGAVANTGRKEYRRVVVDCGNYREEREETLRRVAEKLAAKAVRLGHKVRLEPMNPYERRIVHSALADSEEVFTKSEGKEPERFVVIIPKNPRPYGGKGGRDNRGRGKYDKSRGKDRYSDRKRTYERRDLPTESTPESSGTSIGGRSSAPGYKKGGFSGFFGTFLGNSSDEETGSGKSPETENSDTEE